MREAVSAFSVSALSITKFAREITFENGTDDGQKLWIFFQFLMATSMYSAKVMTSDFVIPSCERRIKTSPQVLQSL